MRCSDRRSTVSRVAPEVGEHRAIRESDRGVIDLSGEAVVDRRLGRLTVRDQLARAREPLASVYAMPRFPPLNRVLHWSPADAMPAVSVATRSMPVPLPSRLPAPLPWASVSAYAMPDAASESPLDLSMPGGSRTANRPDVGDRADIGVFAARPNPDASYADNAAMDALGEIVMQRTTLLRLVAGVAGRKINVPYHGPAGPYGNLYDARNVLVAAFLTLNGANGITQREFARSMRLLYRTFNTWLTRYRRNPDGAALFWATIAPDTAQYATLLVQQLRASRRLPGPTYSDLIASPLHGRLWQTVNGATRRQQARRTAIPRAR